MIDNLIKIPTFKFHLSNSCVNPSMPLYALNVNLEIEREIGFDGTL